MNLKQLKNRHKTALGAMRRARDLVEQAQRDKRLAQEECSRLTKEWQRLHTCKAARMERCTCTHEVDV